MCLFEYIGSFFCYNSTESMRRACGDRAETIHVRFGGRVRIAMLCCGFYISPLHPPIVVLYSPSLRRMREEEKNATFHVFAHVSYPGCENNRACNKACGWNCMCPCDALGFFHLMDVFDAMGKYMCVKLIQWNVSEYCSIMIRVQNTIVVVLWYILLPLWSFGY